MRNSNGVTGPTENSHYPKYSELLQTTFAHLSQNTTYESITLH